MKKNVFRARELDTAIDAMPADAPRIDINADSGVPRAPPILDRLIGEEAG